MGDPAKRSAPAAQVVPMPIAGEWVLGDQRCEERDPYRGGLAATACGSSRAGFDGTIAAAAQALPALLLARISAFGGGPAIMTSREFGRIVIDLWSSVPGPSSAEHEDYGSCGEQL